MHRHLRGFTLIELLVVIAIIGILAAIAIPSYTDYVVRGQLAEPSSALSNFSTQMAQFYQDNHTYQNANGGCGVTAPASPQVKYFTYTCTPCDASASDPTRTGAYTACTNSQATSLGYVVVATSTSQMATHRVGSWVMTLDDQSDKTTQAAPAISAPVVGCWFTSKGQTSC